eukprot:1160298-Pelagomonas_calceolata.AAC.3
MGAGQGHSAAAQRCSSQGQHSAALSRHGFLLYFLLGNCVSEKSPEDVFDSLPNKSMSAFFHFLGKSVSACSLH